MAIDIRILADDPSLIPTYGSDAAAGCDLRAAPDEPMVICAGGRAAIPTGLRLEIPEGFEGQVRPRSGLALKTGLTVLNAPGTIDADYRGEVRVILINNGTEDVTINHGDRIAQLVFSRVEKASFIVSDSLEITSRGEGGFGSTGIS